MVLATWLSLEEENVSRIAYGKGGSMMTYKLCGFGIEKKM
jgi:hypothetical protein